MKLLLPKQERMTKKELQLILEGGEGYLIEFKERLTHLDREMVAFANGAGGRIFLGVADRCEVQGIRITNSLKSQIQDMANNCDPPVRMGYIEKMGTGIKRMQNLMAEANQAPIVFEFTGFVTAKFSRIVADAFPGIGKKTSETASEKKSEKILSLIGKNCSITIAELSQRVGISTRSIERNLKKLQQDKRLKRIGPAKGGHWEIQQPSRKDS